MENLKFSALRGLANFLIVLGWILIIGGSLVSLLMYLTDTGWIFALSVFGGGLLVGFMLIINGQALELQLGIYDQLVEHTRLLKRIVNLNLPTE